MLMRMENAVQIRVSTSEMHWQQIKAQAKDLDKIQCFQWQRKHLLEGLGEEAAPGEVCRLEGQVELGSRLGWDTHRLTQHTSSFTSVSRSKGGTKMLTLKYCRD